MAVKTDTLETLPAHVASAQRSLLNKRSQDIVFPRTRQTDRDFAPKWIARMFRRYRYFGGFRRSR
jgi:hypothetical protein